MARLLGMGSQMAVEGPGSGAQRPLCSFTTFRCCSVSPSDVPSPGATLTSVTSLQMALKSQEAQCLRQQGGQLLPHLWHHVEAWQQLTSEEEAQRRLYCVCSRGAAVV